MATTITSVDTENAIRYANFVSLEFASAAFESNTIGTLYMSDADRPYTIDGNNYTALSWLMNVSEISQSFRSTQSDVTITINDLTTNGDSNFISETFFLQSLRGGEVDIKRSFFNAAGDVLETINVYHGIVSNVAIDEQMENGVQSITVSFSCVSIDSVLERTVSGQRTNGTSRRKFYPGDISFDRVAYVQNSKLGFKQ